MQKKPEFKGQEYKSLFFPAGLLLTLMFAYGALEHKTYVESYETITGEMLEDDTIEIPLVNVQPPPPPPPPPPAPAEVFEVVEDEVDIVETIIASTETDQEEIIEIVEVEEEWEEVDIPFAVVEQKPAFPGSTPSKFQNDIFNHIRKHFRYPQTAQELGIQGRVYIRFVITKSGKIEITGLRGPDKNLEREARRIISKLPIMEPGRQRGNAVNVPFSIPITFRLQ